MKIIKSSIILSLLFLFLLNIFGQSTKDIAFTDDFESGSSQWILNDGWGLDTMFVYNGTYSLSDSPDSNYVDSTELLPEGGSVAEVDQVFDFSSASDANIEFWLRYDIEVNFDYLYFQVCKDGVNWVTLKTWTGDDTVWASEYISLSIYAGESTVKFRFLLTTDLGITAEGTNIDDLSITMITEQEPTPPYVIYSKEKDYYDNNPEGFEISATMVDFSDIYTLNVLYTVDGGPEQSLSPYSVVDYVYDFQIPEQTPGAYVEFKFDTYDQEEPPNHWYTQTYFYTAGLHQKYDSGVSSYTSDIVTSTNLNDIKSYAVKFSSFHDDIVGVVLRGYDDVSQIEDNSQMIINVWADDNGSPGAQLITPFAVPNPATLAETNKWVYVDLSSYSELWNIEGDIFIGIECAEGETGVTRTLVTDTVLEGETCYGRSYSQYYSESGLVWEQSEQYNFHIRAVTTNYQLTPGIIDANPNILDENVGPGLTKTVDLTLTNSGGFDYDYTATLEYLTWPDKKAKADAIAESNDFESGLAPYINNPGDWYVGAGLTGNCAQVNTQGLHILETPLFDGTVCTELYLNFDQNAVFKTGSYFNVEYSDNAGSSWTQIYNGTTSTTVSPHITFPTVSSTMKIRFIGNLTKVQGVVANWMIDNVNVYGPESIPFEWLFLDGGSSTSGTVTTTGNDVIEVGFDCTDPSLDLGDELTAVIHITSEFADPVDVPVKMTVMFDPIILDIPVLQISATDSTITLFWDLIEEATSYDIYYSADPYGTFVYLDSVTTNEYTVPLGSGMFYYAVAVYPYK